MSEQRKPRRKQGEGHVEQMASGRWRVRLSVDGRRRSLGTYDSEPEAQEVLDAARQKILDGEAVPVGGSTLRAFGERWLDELALGGRAQMKNLRWTWNRTVAQSPWGERALASLTRDDVRAWLRWLLAKGYKRTTAAHYFSNLRQCLEAAVDEGLIAANPAAFRRRTFAKRDSGEGDSWTYLHPEEQTALLSCEAIPAADRALLKVLLGAGLRASELCALPLADLIADGPHPRLVLRKTKSKRPRVVPLFGLSLEGAREWLALLPDLCPANRKSLAFPTASGAQRQRNAIFGKRAGGVRRWPEYLRAAGIDRRVRIHDLRHTCASSLVAGWWGRAWSLLEVRDFLGHANVAITQRYAHLASSVLAEAARATQPAPSPRTGSEQARIARDSQENGPATGALRLHSLTQWGHLQSVPADSQISDPARAARGLAESAARGLTDSAADWRERGRALRDAALAERIAADPWLEAVARYDREVGGPHEADAIADMARVVLAAAPAAKREAK